MIIGINYKTDILMENIFTLYRCLNELTQMFGLCDLLIT